LRTIFTYILAIVFCFPGYSQKKLKVAPYNPDYLNFLNEYHSGENIYAAPSPMKLNFEQYFMQKPAKSPTSYPLVYDMRTAGPGGSSLLTPVKHQSSCGACWAFATYGSIESVWKVMGLGDHDLSENNLKNCSGFLLDPCQWGHHFMSTAYLVRGDGPIAEADDPYQPDNDTCQGGITPTAYIPESRYLPEDHDAFKEAIMNQGAVYNTYRSAGSGYEWINGHYTYCYQGTGTTSHAIAIVGWDDTIATQCGSGAWICKNEYGTGFGEDGYFYISYQDTLVLKYNSIWPVREEYDPEMLIYHYDTVGGWPFVGYDDSVAYGLIKFVADGDHFFTSIGTYTVSYGTHLQADIYDDFDGTSLSNLLATVPEQYCDNPGYWMLNLSEPLGFNSGDDFYVQIRYNSPGLDFPIAVEGYEEGYTDPHVETGKCWSREETGEWEAWGMGTSNEFDICIKAYGYEVSKVDIKVFLEGPFNSVDMNTDLATDVEFPLSQPYTTSPWNYPGTETVTSVPANVVDWILVELRETDGTAADADASTVVDVRAGFLLNDGSVVDLDGISPLKFNVSLNDNLYVAVYHRNHLPVLSADPLPKVSGNYIWNFSDGITKAYGGPSGHKDLGAGICGMISGDGESTGSIDDFDLQNSWNIQAGQQGYKGADFNLNKQVNNTDKNNYWVPNNGSSSQVPD